MCSLRSLIIGNLADSFNTKNRLDNSGTSLQRGFWFVANMIYKAKVCLGNIKIKNEFWAVLGSLKAAREQHMGNIFLTPIASPPGGG